MTTRQDSAPEQRSPLSEDAIWRLPVTVCRITQFLGARTSGTLLERAVAATGDTLRPSTVDNQEVIPEIRRSRSAAHFAAPELLAAVHEVLPAVEHTLGVDCRHTEPEYSLNVHNDGDFYRSHQDTTPAHAPRRLLTFVYYLHRTPRPFTGGELRVFDAALPLHTGTTGDWRQRTWRDWEPEHDSIVFFLPTAWHEVRPVVCPTGRHRDSRFALNGWLCSPEPAPRQNP
ncbi:2OG-Fe(II) oxygenase [Streptacidiphilus sp. P02-A3a]|uniref:2OG-Fe(II) oxygenase n=1 Tax=Streptacidiphilus sp. P02-A3a TaxID=2704468 RepID=UPI0015FE3858|nr:2OG-Fe(II) oxygenase [Streptacidiphilus sp. P02-A3a]QMU67793.1 oxygenase [Streptacidiphilus sp. P02-A3a]